METKIIVLSKDKNGKGDLFGRLTSDLLHVLGYEKPRLNIHKSGREIDFNSNHRAELKIAIGECKAHKEKIGGDQVNKFIGVLDAERRVAKKTKKKPEVVGYFISLSGFTETALQQELDVDNRRVILFDSNNIVKELEAGRVISDLSNAISTSSKLIGGEYHFFNEDVLFATQWGWIRCLFFSKNKQSATHFLLVHAEGQPLITEIARELVEIESSIDNSLSGLMSLNDTLISDEVSMYPTVKDKYFSYLAHELGEIQFEGLPTDKDAGLVKIKLEEIFVPLHFVESNEEDGKRKSSKRESLPEIFEKTSKIAVLAKPGGGKSTLIKRLAMAYAFPERRKEVNDNLPNKEWFPIFFRCRELAEKAQWPITKIINSIPSRAEMIADVELFNGLISQKLQTGLALLLIDGLDEITDDRSRIIFVNQLRTFMATYPSVSLVITSREAGFRVVAGSLAEYCQNFRVAGLETNEIHNLTLKWHKAILDNSENTKVEAKKVSDLIVQDKRIGVLAKNPLLLTTLLFVKRWAGYLPTKKNVLYQEMIKLLLVTWNVEGHEILDIDEAEPQLAYVAYWMTKNGQQTISEDELKRCLIEARKQMPEILGYTNISPNEFISRVESRSSLLIMSGHKRDKLGNLTQIYEFLHLSFQEFLTAKAIVKKYITSEDANLEVVELMKPHASAENWKEVVPLVAVLLERDCKMLISFLVNEARKKNQKKKTRRHLTPFELLIGSCLAYEVQVTPEILEEMIEVYAKSYTGGFSDNSLEVILKSKFSRKFKETVWTLFFATYDDEHFSTIATLIAEIEFLDSNRINAESLDDIFLGLQNDDFRYVTISSLKFMIYCYNIVTKDPSQKRDCTDVLNKLYILLLQDDLFLKYSISWSLAWAGRAGLLDKKNETLFSLKLLEYWIDTPTRYKQLRRVISWAISTVFKPYMKFENVTYDELLKSKIIESFKHPKNEFDSFAAVCLDTAFNRELDSTEVSSFFNQHPHHRRNDLNYALYIEELGITVTTEDDEGKSITLE